LQGARGKLGAVQHRFQVGARDDDEIAHIGGAQFGAQLGVEVLLLDGHGTQGRKLPIHNEA